MKIKMLPASYGDCMLIELKNIKDERFTILIDGGTVDSYKKGIKIELENYLMTDRNIDLVIVTHSDNDHISGMNYILSNNNIVSKINRVIYNSPYAIGKKFNCWNEKDLAKTILPKVIAKTKVSTGFRKKEIIEQTERLNVIETDVNTSAVKANKLQQILFDLEKLEMELITNDGKGDVKLDGINIQFLSPTEAELKDFFDTYKLELSKKNKNTSCINTSSSKSDYDVPFEELVKSQEKKKLSSYNMASLAFTINEESTGESILIMGDSSYGLVTKKLTKLKNQDGFLYNENNPLKLNYLKLSHHGSICDLDKGFLKIIDCDKFLISTDGSIFRHPDKKLIARVYSVFNDGIFYFNYEKRKNDITREGGTIEQICKYQREF